MANRGLTTYALLSRLGFPKSYRGKIFCSIFVSMHVPTVALVLYLLLCLRVSWDLALGVLGLLLVVTLAGTAATLYALNGLLAPVRLACSSLREYVDSNTMPNLPIKFADEAGRLMADVQYAIDKLDSTIRSLGELSGRDHLTGLYNRRECEERLAKDIATAKRGEGALTVAMVDLNHFKSINDAYGHQAGDACLRHLANVIKRNIRESDWLARWGGDEFVVALRDASVFAPTEAVLQRIVKGLKESPVRLPQGIKLTLSVTIGASQYHSQDNVRDLVIRADDAMYEAKRESRPWILAL